MTKAPNVVCFTGSRQVTKLYSWMKKWDTIIIRECIWGIGLARSTTHSELSSLAEYLPVESARRVFCCSPVELSSRVTRRGHLAGRDDPSCNRSGYCGRGHYTRRSTAGWRWGR